MSTRPNNGLLKSLALLLPLLMPLSASAEYEEVIYYHNDALGSPVLATDANGDVLWQEDYTPYGSRLRHESRELSGPLAEPKDDQWDETTWFTGKPEETRLGILNFGARWYEPELGRFLAMDPVGVDPKNIFSFNRYVYANNNPYRYIDPDGRAAIAIEGGIVLVGAGLIYYGTCNSSNPSCAAARDLGNRFNKSIGNLINSIGGMFNESEEGERTADDPLPRDKDGNPIPESDSPHTQLGKKEGRNGEYVQGREFGENGEHIKDIDFTDHGRSGHPNPHEHQMEPNPSGGTPRRGPPRPLRGNE